MADILAQYYRCPENSVRVVATANSCGQKGFFSFGENVVCYGNAPRTTKEARPLAALYDAGTEVSLRNGAMHLAFDPTEVVANLRAERYVNNHRSFIGKTLSNALRNAYYSVRPMLGVSVRRHFQKLKLNNWQDIPFPHWPVDTTVDAIHRELLRLHLSKLDPGPIPFIWFWPDGADACAIMTHDVETQLGVDFCARLMDINENFNIPASFQVIPEMRYKVTDRYLRSLRDRGFEINVQDLNHDGHLFRDEATFRERVRQINQYGVAFGARGFRSAVLYHNQNWYELLDFEYDMSVPNVGHLDPQRGGCCTVMPYFVGKVLELPVTATQDYTLFHILNDYSLDLWQQQIQSIQKANGLISFIVHPDYIIDGKPQRTYVSLLEELNELRRTSNLWITLPSEVNRWWRQRSQLQIVQRGDGFQVEGPGSERARLAFASCVDGALKYRLAPQGQLDVLPIRS